MKKLKGIIVPLVTPLENQDVIDFEGAKILLERIIAGGASAAFLLGTTGEMQSLSMDTRYDFVSYMCRLAEGRIPVMVAVTETSFAESVRFARHAAECGASAVVAAAPYYFSSSQNELKDWYIALADASPLPVYLYNMPSHVKVFLEVPLVCELAAHPNIVGLKDSSGNMTYFSKLLHHFKDTDFAIYMGPEEQTAAAVMMGADGGVNGGANMFPELYVALYEAAAAGDFKAVNELQTKVMDISAGVYDVAGGSSSYLRGLKCALGILGICNDFVSLPYCALDEHNRSIIKANLEKWQ